MLQNTAIKKSLNLRTEGHIKKRNSSNADIPNL